MVLQMESQLSVPGYGNRYALAKKNNMKKRSLALLLLSVSFGFSTGWLVRPAFDFDNNPRSSNVHETVDVEFTSLAAKVMADQIPIVSEPPKYFEGKIVEILPHSFLVSLGTNDGLTGTNIKLLIVSPKTQFLTETISIRSNYTSIELPAKSDLNVNDIVFMVRQ